LFIKKVVLLLHPLLWWSCSHWKSIKNHL